MRTIVLVAARHCCSIARIAIICMACVCTAPMCTTHEGITAARPRPNAHPAGGMLMIPMRKL